MVYSKILWNFWNIKIVFNFYYFLIKYWKAIIYNDINMQNFI